MESSGCLPFVLLFSCRVNQTSVYRKCAHTGRYLDYDFHHPLSHKKSVVSTLMNRAYTHSSTTSSLNKEVKHVGNTLRMNGYPSRLTKDPMKSSRCSLTQHTSDQTTCTRWQASELSHTPEESQSPSTEPSLPWSSEYVTNDSRTAGKIPERSSALSTKTRCGLSDSLCHLQQPLHWLYWKEAVPGTIDEHRRAVRQKN